MAMAVLVLLFVVLPIVEIWVAIQVAHHIGGGNTIALLVIFSVLGAMLAKRAGFGVLARMRDQVDRGVLPGNEIIDGVLVLAAGVLLLVPGFVTGIVGLVLLLPPVRHAVRAGITRSLRGRVYRVIPNAPNGPNGPGGPIGPGDVIDV
jgi:UPF0716 protein FxsA